MHAKLRFHKVINEKPSNGYEKMCRCCSQKRRNLDRLFESSLPLLEGLAGFEA